MSREFWLEFIRLYRSFPCLWDTKDPSYIKKDVRREAYDVLLAKVHEIDSDATLDSVKKKIDSFRTAFRREEKKVALSMHFGASDDKIYSPTLWYYRELEEFLGYSVEDQRNIIISRMKSNNEMESSLSVERFEESSDDDYSIQTPPLLKRVKITDQSTERPTIFAQPIAVPQTEVEDDDCSTFVAHLKVQMRGITKDQNYIAQKLMSDVMFLARTNRLTYNSSVLPDPVVATTPQASVMISPDLILPNDGNHSKKLNQSIENEFKCKRRPD